VYAGFLDPSTPIQSLLVSAKDSHRPQPQRHFSAFPLTSHLHTPTIRLVSLHPLLVVPLVFVRVPEIHDGFTYSIFTARSTTVEDVIQTAVDELGLTKTLPVPGGGNLDYVLEEFWSDGVQERGLYSQHFTSSC
jgi:diaphanous 1